MEISNEFDVPASPAEAWALLLDVERVVPCVPGAELTEVVDDSTWRGKMGIKLGPIRLSFAGEVHLEETDEESHKVEMRAQGRETRGKGNAQANVTSVLTPSGSGTRIALTTDLKLSGPVAQYGRGMIQDVSSKMIDQFAACLASQLTGPAAEAEPTRSEAAAPAQTPAAGADRSAPDERAPAPVQSPAAGKPLQGQPPVQGVTLILGALWRAIVRLVRNLRRR
jgi:carbon monoxide dehydrogenase subunit G